MNRLKWLYEKDEQGFPNWQQVIILTVYVIFVTVCVLFILVNI